MAKTSAVLKAAYVAAGATIFAAILSAILQPSWWRPTPSPTTDFVVAGAVVDRDTNRGIGQAVVIVAGRTEQYITEDSGNFRIDFHAEKPRRLRLRISKDGYYPLDQSVEPPAENLILQLKSK